MVLEKMQLRLFQELMVSHMLKQNMIIKQAKLNIVLPKKLILMDFVQLVKCYGADDVQEGVAIMHHENVGVSITGNSTNPTRFQHPVAGTYKKECIEQGKKYFSVASGGGTGTYTSSR